MSRQPGMLNLSGNIEVNAGAPLDSRSIVPTLADLTVAANFPYKYIGMRVTVQATGDMYTLMGNDVTDPNNWKQMGSGDDQTIQVDELPAASSTEEGNIYQYVGQTTVNYTHGYFYECVEVSGGSYEWQNVLVQKDGHTILEADGTAMASRSKLQFGGDFDVEDDSANDKTKVLPHEITGAEWAEIMPIMPNPIKYPVIFDERGTEYQVGWYVYSNGTKKPIYMKNYAFAPYKRIDSAQWATIITDDPNIDILLEGKVFLTSGVSTFETMSEYMSICFDKVNRMIKGYNGLEGYLLYDRMTIIYTKTTDTAQ